MRPIYRHQTVVALQAFTTFFEAYEAFAQANGDEVPDQEIILSQLTNNGKKVHLTAHDFRTAIKAYHDNMSPVSLVRPQMMMVK